MGFETDYLPEDGRARAGIRHYSVFDADVGLATIARASPARPQQFLQIVLEGEHRLRNVETGRIVRSGRASLIGLCTYRRYNLMVSGRLRLFFVQFQPGALHAWTGRDMSTLTDACVDAREAFGPEIDALATRLASAEPESLPHVADAFFSHFPAPEIDEVVALARAIREDYAFDWGRRALSGLSARQFQRRFARQVGVTPKLYARLCRLAAVIDLHERDPSLTWTELAHDCGYADQAHLTREFQEFVRAAPSRFRPLTPAQEPVAA